MKHKHYTNKLRAAWELYVHGIASAHTATYTGLSCACGERKRNTRLAASIIELRQSGVVITTTQAPKEQAIYHIDDSQKNILETLLGLNFGF